MAVPSLGMLMLLCRILYCSLLLNMATQLVFPSGCLGAANIRCVLALLQYQHTSKLQVIPYTMCDVQVMPYTMCVGHLSESLPGAVCQDPGQLPERTCGQHLQT